MHPLPSSPTFSSSPSPYHLSFRRICLVSYVIYSLSLPPSHLFYLISFWPTVFLLSLVCCNSFHVIHYVASLKSPPFFLSPLSLSSIFYTSTPLPFCLSITVTFFVVIPSSLSYFFLSSSCCLSFSASDINLLIFPT